MDLVDKAIEDWLNKYKETVIKSQKDKGIRSSGASAESLRVEVKDKNGKLFGFDYFDQQQFGRKPGNTVKGAFPIGHLVQSR